MKAFFKKSSALYICLVFFGAAALGCKSEPNKDDQGLNKPEPVQIDLAQIKERGKIKAITTYSSTSYFIYKGRPMGFEYELLVDLAKHLDLDLEIVLAEDLDDLTGMLNSGEGDLIAFGLTITQPRKEQVDFTKHYTTTRQVLVQRMPVNWHRLKYHHIESMLIRNQIELIGKPVYVRKNTSYYERLINLSNEIGGDIDIIPVPGNTETEELIRKVSDGEIDYTIADQHIAQINQTYYRNLDVKTPVSFPQRIAWAVRKNSPELLEAVNEWIVKIKRKPYYNIVFNKYFKNRSAYSKRVKSPFYSKNGGNISQYDDLIKTYARELNWDWRLLASMIYQESRFNPAATSWMGARGLMQVMPATAELFGYNASLERPEVNLKAGITYIKFLKRLWKDIPDSTERQKFILASYNVGQGHVMDARRLAEKHGKDPDIWTENVENLILAKSEPAFYNDPVVKHGYCRGQEPYDYVRGILERYELYTKVLEADA
jgi:membrane-bound lytic murein transglycosylase F